MIDRITKSEVAAIIFLIILMHISISWTVITLFLGLLLIPPIAVAACIFIQGIPLLKREMEDLLASGKYFFLISISKEHITLEPQFR